MEMIAIYKIEQPKARSDFRIKMGKLYFIIKRFTQWYTDDKKYSKGLTNEKLGYIITNHKTPLYRKLKDVDMYLQHNKVINLNIATKKISNIIIKPGETFSYWKLIGNPTKRKGYVDGMVLHYGKYTTGTGGGLCQLSNLLFWMALNSPLKVVERYRHSYDVFPDSNRTQPFGSGATCVYNYRDLQIYNDTDDDFQIILYLDNEYLKGEVRSNRQNLYSYKIYEKDHKITHEHWGDYVRHNLIYRKIYDLEGNLLEDEYIAENHALMMYQPFIEKQKTNI